MRNERLILFTIGIIMMMESLDGNALNTSLPQIAYSLQVNPINLKIAVTIYLLTLGAFIPVASWFADRFGIKKVLSVSISGFLIASILCGLSLTLPMITVFRALQGLFAAFTMPLARLLIVRLFSHDYVRAMATIGPLMLIGSMLGPLIGGMITTWINWRFIFFLNLPIGLLAMVAIYYCFPKLYADKPYPFDYIGFMLIGLALVLALFAIDTVVDVNIHTPVKILSFLLSLGLFLTYYYYAKSRSNRIINIKLFHLTTYRRTIVTSAIVRIFTVGISFLIPLYLQTQFSYSALMAGLVLLPFIIASIFSKFTIRYLNKKLSYKTLATILFLSIVVAELGMSYLLLYFNLAGLLLMLFIMGWGISGLVTLLNTKIYSSLDKQTTNDGTTINSAIIQLSGSFAVAIIAMILIISSQQYLLTWQTILPKSAYAMVMLISAGCIFLLNGFNLMLKSK